MQTGPAALRTFGGAVAIVTGAASGIGRALAEELTRRGSEVPRAVGIALTAGLEGRRGLRELLARLRVAGGAPVVRGGGPPLPAARARGAVGAHRRVP